MTAKEPIDEHIRCRYLELGREVLGRKRVYLDTRFWLLLRDVVLGRRRETDLVAIFDLLTGQVAESRLLCPIEASAFIELCRQSDPETRLATAKLMDRLSRGVCISYVEDRCRAELLYFLRKHGIGSRNLLHPQELIWTKIGNVFGEGAPSSPAITKDAEAAIQIEFYDHLWRYSVEAVVRTIGPSAELPHFDDRGWADRLDAGKRTHAGELRSLRHAYRIELRGALDAWEDLLASAFRDLFEEETGNLLDPAEVTEASSIRDLKALIIARARKRRLDRDLPSFQIPALLHADMRWNRTRHFKPTDRMDFHHATAALPYCQVFLTDGPLAALLRSPGIALDRHFGVTVAAEFSEALEAVRALVS